MDVLLSITTFRRAMRNFCLSLFFLLAFGGSALAQGNQCRTAPVGASTPNCASEAFVTESVAAGGTVTSVGSGIGLTGGPITGSGSLALDPSYLRGYLAGLTLSNDGTSPNSVLDISAGVATDSTSAALIKIGAFTKSTAGAWAVGSGSNGMGNGLTIANATWYHVCLTPNGGSPDIWFDTSAACVNKPAGVSGSLSRRIGSFKTDASAHILAFFQVGNWFRWATPVLDVSNASFPTTYTTTTISVPPGVPVLAFGNINAGTGSSYVQIKPVGASDPTLSTAILTTAVPLSKVGAPSGAEPVTSGWQQMTNTSAQISIGGNATIGTYLTTEGWFDFRGKS